MGSLRRLACALVLLLPALVLSGARGAQDPRPAPDPNAPLIQIALLLDTSNSMDGLINQAKTELWDIVNQFAAARKEGKAPELQVALYQYGNTGIPKEKGYIRQVLPFTAELDKVSQKLFALTTNGGDEYCGQVVAVALKELEWIDSPSVVKAIFIAGNEPFTQGTIDFRGSCRAAAGKQISVNTIFCGASVEGVRTSWKEGADLTKGAYMAIDQSQTAVVVAAPQDKEIATLTAALNKTYVPYGREGAQGQLNQMAQDTNAAANGQLALRAATRGSNFYRNGSWDLVDAVNEKRVKLEEVKDADLPEVLRPMNLEQRRAYLTQQMGERGRIQTRINALNTERERFVAAEVKKRGAAANNTLGAAVSDAVRAQASRQGYRFKK